MAASALAASRLPRMTWAPTPASCSATKYPMPALPPVTRTCLPSARGTSQRMPPPVHEVDQLLVDLGVGGGDQPLDASVDGLAVEVGHHAAGCLAQRDAAGEVHAVAKVPVGDVGGPPPGRDPGQCQRRGHDAGAEVPGE